MEKNTEIYGIRSVIEAINSSKDIDKVFIQTGLKGALIGKLESLIINLGLFDLGWEWETDTERN